MKFEITPKEKYFDNILKDIIRLFIPYKRMKASEEFFDALEEKKDFSLEYIQNIVSRLQDLFPDEIKQLNRSKYREWIQQNETKWKEKKEPMHLDKLFYGLAKETT
ncbi:MAG: hypothetical protein ACTSPS_09275 [Promethearchaeota archaeon]